MKQYKGMAAADGIVHATAVVARTVDADTVPETLDEAVEACRIQLRALYEKTLAELGKDSAAIFEAYEALLTDKYMLDPIRKLQEDGETLSRAVETAMEKQAAVFAKAKSSYMQERADDIRNIKEMLLRKINGSALEFVMPVGDAPVIIVAETLSPADTMALDKNRLAGFVTCYGGVTSHVVILAKKLGIPAITGFDRLSDIADGDSLFLDGSTGEVIIEPDKEMMTLIEEKIRMQEEFESVLRDLPKGDPVTLDARQVHVSVNIGGAEDLEGLDLESLYGVGLFRTEFLFVDRNTAPTMEEQLVEYKKVFDALEGKDLIVRTLDIGGDKEVPYLKLPKEDNPFLGCRGIRLCFRYPQLLRDQFEALLRASMGRPFSIMFPMVNTVREYKKARSIWGEVKNSLEAQNVPVNDAIRLGVMIETPSAFICSDMLAETVDFASIGTNDLTQYILAADRGNPETGVNLSVCSPAMVRALSQTIAAFTSRGVKISVCGEAGSDLKFMPLMLGMGLSFVSVSRSMIDRVRYTVMHTDCGEQARLLEKVLNLEDEDDIQKALECEE